MLPLELRGTQPAGRRMPLGKYDVRNYALTNAQFEAHVAGRASFGAELVGADGTGRALCVDVDNGGRPALRRALQVCAAMGIWAIATYSPGRDHDGGHLWVFFAGDTDPERLEALGYKIAQLARLEDCEIFPRGKARVRLPFAVHLDTGRRGVADTTDGESFDLDTAGEVERALRAVEALGRNSLALLPPLPPKEPRNAARVALGSDESPARAYSRAATVDQVVSLLESMPGYSEHKRKGGRVILRCGCGQHSREANPAAIYVETGRNGKALVYSFSTDCRWSAGPGEYHDAFTVYCEVHRLTPKEAALQLLAERRDHGAHHSPGSRRDDRHALAGTARAEPARAADAGALIPHAPHREPTAPPPAPEELAAGRTGRERLLNALRLHESRGGDCLASEAQLARCAALTERYTRILLRQLAREGAITETRRYGQTTVRVVHTHAPAVCTTLAEGGGSFLTFRSPTCIHESESPESAWEKEGIPPGPLPPGGTVGDPPPEDLEDQVAADLERVLARRAEAAQRAALEHLVFDLAAIAGVALPADLPADLGELEALAGELLAQGEALEAPAPAPVAIAEAPVTIGHTGPAGAVQFEGGCSFDPAAAGKIAPPLPRRPRSLEEHMAAVAVLYEYHAARVGEAPPAAAPALEALPPPPELRRGPPRDFDRRQRYYSLLFKAKRTKSLGQKRVLERLAAELEDVYTPQEWADFCARRDGRAPAAPEGPQVHAGEPSGQLGLWGTGTAPEEPSFFQAHARAAVVAICAD
jgi:hypothetical protein